MFKEGSFAVAALLSALASGIASASSDSQSLAVVHCRVEQPRGDATFEACYTQGGVEKCQQVKVPGSAGGEICRALTVVSDGSGELSPTPTTCSDGKVGAGIDGSGAGRIKFDVTFEGNNLVHVDEAFADTALWDPAGGKQLPVGLCVGVTLP